jgi:hypothetical protein
MGSRRVSVSLAGWWGGVGVLLVALAGCVGRDNPESAAREFVRAALSGEYALVFQRLTPGDQARLRALARRATAQGGGRQRFGPEDMLSSSIPSELRHGLARVERVSEAGDSAKVRLVDSSGKYTEIWRLKRHEGRWRVLLESINR